MKNNSGQSAVEIALLLPLLLTIVMGIAIVTFIFLASIQVTNATREGARAGSLYRITRTHLDSNGNAVIYSLNDTVNWAIYDPRPQTPTTSLGYLPPISYTVGIDYSGDTNNPRAGDIITVALTYSYTVPVLSVMLPMFQSPTVLQNTVVMVVQ